MELLQVPDLEIDASVMWLLRSTISPWEYVKLVTNAVILHQVAAINIQRDAMSAQKTTYIL